MSTTYYVDIVNGKDNNKGTDIDKPFLTLAKAYTSVTSGADDVIFLLNTGITTTINETLTIAKDDLTIIGEKGHIELKPSTSGSDTITITGAGVKLLNFTVSTAAGGTDDAISISNTNNIILEKMRIEDATANGILISDTVDVEIEDVHIDSSAGDGIRLEATVLGATSEVIINGTLLHDNTGYGINVSDANVTNTVINSDVIYSNNTAGDYQDLGSNSTIGSVTQGNNVAAQVWSAPIASYTDETTFGGYLALTVLTVGRFLALK